MPHPVEHIFQPGLVAVGAVAEVDEDTHDGIRHFCRIGRLDDDVAVFGKVPVAGDAAEPQAKPDAGLDAETILHLDRGKRDVEISVGKFSVSGSSSGKSVGGRLACPQRRRELTDLLGAVLTFVVHGLQYRDALFLRMLYFARLTRGGSDSLRDHILGQRLVVSCAEHLLHRVGSHVDCQVSFALGRHLGQPIKKPQTGLASDIALGPAEVALGVGQVASEDLPQPGRLLGRTLAAELSLSLVGLQQ